MARREDYLLSRLLLTDGTVTFEDFSDILMKWNEKSSKTLLQTIIDENLLSEEEGRGVLMCIEKLCERDEKTSSLKQLDSIFCQILIKKKIVPIEIVNQYQKKISLGGTDYVVSESLYEDGHIPSRIFNKVKRKAEEIYYRRRILALARGQERLSGIFKSPSRTDDKNKSSINTRSEIQKAISIVKTDIIDKQTPNRKKKKTRNLPVDFAHYEIIEEIARGGMGIVYKVKHKALDRIVALKVLHEGCETPDRIKRFHREAQAAQRLKHPNIVGIYEISDRRKDSNHYFTMDYIDGIPLNVLFKKSDRVKMEDYLNIMLELARAVHFAHEHNIIHRDLKPANIIIDLEGHPQITDFGLAKLLDTNTQLTKSDTIIGTPFYMSPEQTRGDNDKIGPCTDIWALGVMLYELTAKQLPFIGRTSIELYHKINYNEPIPVRKLNPSTPRELEYITLKAMEKDPQERYPSAEAMANDIEKYLDGEKIVIKEYPMWFKVLRRWFRHNKWLLVAAIIAILLGWLCGWYLLSQINH